MKYLGIINTMVIMEAGSKKEAMKQLEKQCGQLQLDSKDGQILCSKASGHIVKVNVANTLTSHAESEQSKKETSYAANTRYGYWMQRAIDVDSGKDDWFCSECGGAAKGRKQNTVRIVEQRCPYNKKNASVMTEIGFPVQ